MRIKLYLLLTLALILLALVAMIPWLDGMLFKSHYQSLIAAISETKTVKVQVLEYHQGWFSSDAKVALTPMTNASYTQPSMIIEEHISHGPLVVDPVSQNRVFAMAAIQNKVRLPASLEALLLGNQANPGGVMGMDILARFGGDFEGQVSTPVFTIALADIGKIVWQGLKGTMDLQVVNDHLNQLDIAFTIGALQGQSNAGSILTQNIYLKYQGKPTPIGLWNGFSNFMIPQLTITSSASDNTGISLRGGQITSTFGVGTANNYNHKLQFTVGQLITPAFAMNQSSATIAFNNVSASSLHNLYKATGNLSAQPTLEKNPQFFALIPQLITPATTVTANVNLNTQNGKLLSQGQVSWVGAVKTIDDLTKNIKADATIRMSSGLVNQLIDLAAAESVAHDAQPGQPTEKALLNQIDQWISANQLALDVGIQLKDLVQVHLSPADFARNIDRFALRKDISATLAMQLKQQYAMIKNIKQPTPVQPQLTPAEQIKNQVNALVKSGYVTQTGDDYITTLHYEQGVLKANGLVLQQLVIGMLN